MPQARNLTEMLVNNIFDRNRLFMTDSDSRSNVVTVQGCDSDPERGLGWDVAHFRISPVGICTRWYSPVHSWLKIGRELAAAQISSTSSYPSGVIAPLFKYVKQWNSKVISRLQTPVSNETLLKLVSSLDPGIPPRNPTLVKWSHAMLRSVLLDRVMWATSRDDTNPTPIRRYIAAPMAKYQAEMRKGLQEYVDAMNDWPNTVSEFVFSWRRYIASTHKSRLAQVEEIDDLETCSAYDVGVELADDLNRSDLVQHVATARGNIIAAALGLLAIVNSEKLDEIKKKQKRGAKPTQNTGSDGHPTSKEDGHGRIGRRVLYHILKALCGDAYNKLDADQRDIDVAREVYLAGALSPIGLLTASGIRSKRRNDRLSLQSIMVVSEHISQGFCEVTLKVLECLGIATVDMTEELATIECDLWEIIIKTALYGSRKLDSLIDAKVNSWKWPASQAAVKVTEGVIFWTPSLEIISGSSINQQGTLHLAKAVLATLDISQSDTNLLQDAVCSDWLEHLARDFHKNADDNCSIQEIEGNEHSGDGFGDANEEQAGERSNAEPNTTTICNLSPSATGMEGSRDKSDKFHITSNGTSGRVGNIEPELVNLTTPNVTPRHAPSPLVDRGPIVGKEDDRLLRKYGVEHDIDQFIQAAGQTGNIDTTRHTRTMETPVEDLPQTYRSSDSTDSRVSNHSLVSYTCGDEDGAGRRNHTGNRGRKRAKSVSATSGFIKRRKHNDSPHQSAPSHANDLGDANARSGKRRATTHPAVARARGEKHTSKHRDNIRKSMPLSSRKGLPPYARNASKTPAENKSRNGVGKGASAYTGEVGLVEIASKADSRRAALQSEPSKKFMSDKDASEEIPPVYSMADLTEGTPLKSLGVAEIPYVHHVWSSDGTTVRLEHSSVTVPRWHGLCDRLDLFRVAASNAYEGFPGAYEGRSEPLSRDEWETSLHDVDGAVKEFSSREWDPLPEPQKQEIFKRNNVLVRAIAGEDSETSGLTGWGDKRLRKALNFKVVRQAHDLTIPLKKNQHPSARIRKAKLSDLVKNCGCDPEHVLNFPDVSLHGVHWQAAQLVGTTSMTILDLDDVVEFLHDHSPWFVWKTPAPDRALQRAMIANTSAVSASHIDAGGFATWIHILLGRKTWYIAVRTNDQLPYSNGWANSEYRWIGLDLRKGDRLYMRPNTVHLVVTSEHCLAVGGHFYCKLTLQRTLEAMVLEHFFSKYITNTNHPTSPVLLFKLLNHYAEVCIDLLNDPGLRDFSSVLPPNRELASLLLLIANVDQLEPDGVDEDKRWHTTEAYRHDRDRALALADRLSSICMQHVYGFVVELVQTEAWLQELVDACRRRFDGRILGFVVKRLSSTSQ